MVLQCYDFLTDSAIPIDRYLLLCGEFSRRRGCAEIPERWVHLYEGGGEPILVGGLTYIGRDDDLYRMAKKAI